MQTRSPKISKNLQKSEPPNLQICSEKRSNRNGNQNGIRLRGRSRGLFTTRPIHKSDADEEWLIFVARLNTRL